jgi:hypothetical protein
MAQATAPSTTWRGQCWDRPDVVVQRVVKEVASMPFPQLTHDNYEDRSILIKVKLEAQSLLDVLAHGDANRQEDNMALDARSTPWR